jgi:hypothetical protein
MGFSHFQVVQGVEAILPIECEIPSLKIVVDLLPDMSKLKEWFIHLKYIGE